MKGSDNFVATSLDEQSMATSHDHPQQFTVREQCGRAWSDELLSFSINWQPGEQQNVPLQFSTANGPVTTQITDVVYHPDGSLARATAWCRVSLTPDETVTLRLAEGQLDTSAPLPYWRESSDRLIEAGNGRCAVQIPRSGSYACANAPGPILAVRVGDGEWIGRGALHASQDVLVTTELLAQGPLFLRWRSSFRYERITLATFECTLYTGEDFIHIREKSSRDSDLVLNFDLFPNFAPDRWTCYGGGERNRQAMIEIDYARPETITTVDFNSGHQQMSLTWFGVYHEGRQECIGVVELNGQTWTNVSVNRLHLVAAPPESLLISTPLQGGVKEWALACSSLADNIQAPGSTAPIRLCLIHQRYSGFPLQKIKDWVLDWEADQEARPFLQCESAGIVRVRQHVQETPELLQAYQHWTEIVDHGESITISHASTLATLWIALGEERYAREAVAALEKEIRTSIETCWAEGGMIRLIIFHGRSMKMWLQAYDVLMAGGFIDEAHDRAFRRDFAFLAYCFADAEFFPKQYNLADHNDPDSFYYGMGQTIGDAVCPPNFHTEYFTTYGMMGCCFRTHPQAAEWRREAAQLMERQLEVHFYDSGCYCESPNYHSHVFTMINQFALALRRCGGPDLYQHPRFKAQFDYFTQMQTPPILMNEAARRFITPAKFLDPDRERYAMLPSNGNTGSDCSDMPLPVELAIGGVVYRDTDPALSARCMTTWRRAGRPIANAHDDLSFLLLADLNLAGAEQLELRSALLTGSYATFRGNPETADEVYVLTKNGTATHHNCFDEGGFTIWAYGSPLASDYGYHAVHDGRRSGTTATWQHNCVEFDEKSSGYLGIEQTSPPEKWVSTELADLLVSYIPITNFRAPGMLYTDQVPATRIEYRRYTLFVKPHYLLVLDSILSCPYTHRWWLHAQADDIHIDGPKVRFTGTYGVDLLAHFITPAAPQLETGEWGVMQHIAARQAQAHDWRVFVAPARPGQDFTVSHRENGRIVRVETPDYCDTIFLAHYPFHFTDAQTAFYGKAGVIRRDENGHVLESVLLDGEQLECK